MADAAGSARCRCRPARRRELAAARARARVRCERAPGGATDARGRVHARCDSRLRVRLAPACGARAARCRRARRGAPRGARSGVAGAEARTRSGERRCPPLSPSAPQRSETLGSTRRWRMCLRCRSSSGTTPMERERESRFAMRRAPHASWTRRSSARTSCCGRSSSDRSFLPSRT